jgi:REP element-mobilizing transposase RayT
MAFWRLYYHLVWSTKDRQPLITPAIEPILYGYMIGKAVWHGGIIHAIGGIATHTHVVASIPPKDAIAEFVKNLKGSSTHHINHGPQRFDLTFGWQRGYGVFSLGAKQLDDAIAYVRHQKEHHQRGNLIEMLERDDDEDDGPVIWNAGEAIKSIRVIKP